ncbi:MAG TPA: tetratricopeptide repeat protein [Terriglobia bacterium]|jgi:Tfp pilus assembly protein PilF
MSGDTPQELAARLWQEAYQHQMNKELDEAVELYQRSIAAYPTAEAYTFLGWTYSWMGRIDAAIEQCRKAIEVDPAFGNPYNDIGSYLMMKGKSDEAIPWFERALQAPRYQSYCFPHMNLARVFESKRDWLRAKDEYHKALAENKDYTPAAQGLARIRGYLN